MTDAHTLASGGSEGHASSTPEPVVAQLLDRLDMGGAEQVAVRIANARATAGRPAFIYVLRRGGDLASQVQPAVGLRYLDIARASVANPIRCLMSLERGYARLASQMRADGVVILQSHLPNANLWALYAALRGSWRTMPTLHNNQEFSYSGRGLRACLVRQAYRLMLRRCGAVVACSEPVRQSLMRELALNAASSPRLVSIPNGVPVPLPSDPERRAAERSRWGVRPDMLLVVAAGRLTEQKNFQVLLMAAALLTRQQMRVKVVIAGEGPLRPDLEGLVCSLGLADVVAMPGVVQEMRALMQAADLFVLPSRFEGLPLVLIEAMACGLAVVGTRIRGIADTAVEGESALLVDVDDAMGLASAMKALLCDPERRTALGAAGRRIVEEHYSLERMMADLERLYARLIADKPPA